MCAFCAMRNLICICFASKNRAKRLPPRRPPFSRCPIGLFCLAQCKLASTFFALDTLLCACVCVFCVYFLYFTCFLSFSYSTVFIKFRLATCLPAVFLFLMRLSRFPFGLVCSCSGLLLVWSLRRCHGGKDSQKYATV